MRDDIGSPVWQIALCFDIKAGDNELVSISGSTHCMFFIYRKRNVNVSMLFKISSYT